MATGNATVVNLLLSLQTPAQVARVGREPCARMGRAHMVPKAINCRTANMHASLSELWMGVTECNVYTLVHVYKHLTCIPQYDHRHRAQWLPATTKTTTTAAPGA